MTTSQATVAAPAWPARARDVLLSEWTKLRSVRSTYWTLLIAAVTAIGGSAIFAVSEAHGSKSPFSPVAGVFIGWLEYPVLAVGILGVLVVTAEYSSGQIRTTFAAVPQRLAVLAAKAGVTGAATLLFGELLAFVAFFGTQAILSGRQNAISLSQPGVLRAVLAGGLALGLIALLGVGLGALIRHTAGAVAALPAVLYLPLLVATLPAPWNDRIGRFTMLFAAYQDVTSRPSASLFSPGLSFVVLIAWPAVALAAAGILLVRRDA
jgi:ABC-2 type transport system permease protein